MQVALKLKRAYNRTTSMARPSKYVLDRGTQPTVTNIIQTRISAINGPSYPKGPALHFYDRVLNLRSQHSKVAAFLQSNDCIEMLYAALLSWGMESRAAEMKDYADFKSNVQGAAASFQAVESAAALQSFTLTSRTTVVQAIESLFDSLALMKSQERTISNSKCMHFIFPDLCIPVDNNTFQKLYKPSSETIWASATKGRFLEVLDFSYDILAGIPTPQQYLDAMWNRNRMKLVDNAIFLM
jgi:hypothetical protein